MEAIDRIEVIRGPMSVIYGQGAFLGAFNIITNEITDKSVSFVSTSYGSEKTEKLFMRAAGLGLSISCGIIQSHKGRIDVETEEGKGTTVSVRFPV